MLRTEAGRGARGSGSDDDDDRPMQVAKGPTHDRFGEVSGAAQVFCATQVRPGLGKVLACLGARPSRGGQEAAASSEVSESGSGSGAKPARSLASRLSARLSIGRRWSAGEVEAGKLRARAAAIGKGFERVLDADIARDSVVRR